MFRCGELTLRCPYGTMPLAGSGPNGVEESAYEGRFITGGGDPASVPISLFNRTCSPLSCGLG